DEFVTVGIDPESSRLAVHLAERFDGVHAAVGMHPNDATDWNDEHRARIDELATEPGVVAIGESGLDFYRDYAPRDRQRAAFRAHIELAGHHAKALIIHTRDSTGAALDMLEDLGAPPRVVFHCWSGDETDLRRALDLGAFVSFAGNVSFTSAQDLSAVAALVPGDRLLVETDSPYLAPVPHRGKPNRPALVPYVGEAVAEARSETVNEVRDQTAVNARTLFGLK
ncbi:MAG: TatD family hydrolase, partial [Actinomycetota bacterium]